MQNIPNICLCLGSERTRNEFLPYLAELLDDEEEVMIHLSEALGNMLDIVGGPTHADSILKVLEKICAVEEISVREKVSFVYHISFSILGYRRNKKNISICSHKRF